MGSEGSLRDKPGQDPPALQPRPPGQPAAALVPLLFPIFIAVRRNAVVSACPQMVRKGGLRQIRLGLTL